MIHVYYGYGKGKTTAALGLILRAVGAGRVCALVQFLKDFASGELTALETLGVPVLRGKAAGHAFVRDMTPAERDETRKIQNDNLRAGIRLAREGRCDLLVLDEALDALSLGLLDEAVLREFLETPPEGVEIAVTGHQPVDWVLARADYITEMVKRAHPYDRGVPARKGVEF